MVGISWHTIADDFTDVLRFCFQSALQMNAFLLLRIERSCPDWDFLSLK